MQQDKWMHVVAMAIVTPFMYVVGVHNITKLFALMLIVGVVKEVRDAKSGERK